VNFFKGAILIFLDKQSKRTKDENGYLIIKDNPIAVAGVFDYLHSELFKDSEDDTVVKVYRDFKDLVKIKDAFIGKPIVWVHQWVGDETNQVDGSIQGEIKVDEETQTLRADLHIYNPKLIEVIESGEVIELSPGYTGGITEKKGRFNGQSYDYTQSVDVVNHLAVVENGRAGDLLKIQDSKTNLKKGENMKKTSKDRFMDAMKKFFKDEETIEKKEEIKKEDEDPKVEDEGKIEKIKEIANSDLDDAEKERLISEILGGKTEDEDPEEKKEDEECNPKQKDDEEIIKKEEIKEQLSPDELAEVIAEGVKIGVEKEMEKYTDSMKKESKRITDTYTKVSDALGTSFDYTNMSANDIYKFGYESLSGNSLDKGMNAETAFLIASQSKRKTNFVDSKPNEKEDNLTKLLERY